MNNFLNSLPRWLLVGGALALALILMFVLKPPHTACDSQFDIFQKSETPFLFLDPSKKLETQTEFHKTMQKCREQNLPGACFQFFEGIHFVLKDLMTVSVQCRPEIAGKDEIKSSLWSALEFIYDLAWGDAPPKSYLEKTGWLDSSNISIFCELQNVVQNNYSKDDWVQFREKILKNLPGASGIGRGETWNRSLFTLKCP